MHTLIIGRTEFGKTAMAKNIGSDLRERGQFVAAYNPICEPGFTRRDGFGCIAADVEFDNVEEFAEYIRSIANDGKVKFVIVDEAHEFFSRIDNGNLWLAQKGRHYGFNIIGCTQRGAQVHPTFRSQCANLYLFGCSKTDADFMADEYGKAELKKATDLVPGQYYACSSKGVALRRLF